MLVGGHEGWGEIGDRLGIGNGLEMIGESKKEETNLNLPQLASLASSP